MRIFYARSNATLLRSRVDYYVIELERVSAPPLQSQHSYDSHGSTHQNGYVLSRVKQTPLIPLRGNMHPTAKSVARDKFASATRSATHAALVVLLASIGACSSKSDQPEIDVNNAPAAEGPAGTTSSDEMAGHNMAGMSDSMQGMSGMAGMTGSPDQDFLRMMSDHHKGLVAMAHLSAEGEKKGSAAVQADARKLDAAQDKELDQMVTMLETTYKDPYSPKVSPDHQTMVNELKGKTGSEYNKLFYADVVKHHRQAIEMINGALPHLTSPAVKAMAEQMKQNQTREIEEFGKKASAS